MSEPKPRTVHHAEIASHIPGRLRVRLHRKSRQPQVLHRLKHELARRPGVQGVKVNPAAGSVTVTYDAQQHPGTGILDLLEDLDVLVGTVVGVPHEEGPGAEEGRSKAALTLAGALDDLDRRLRAFTGYTFDLRVLFPLSLVGTGLWQIRKQGLMLETLPGWLLVWLGVDAFLKLHAPTPTGLRPHTDAPFPQAATVGAAPTAGHAIRGRKLQRDHSG
jgi:hypothetical protein